MKKNLYLLSLGILACSCSEPMDVVTGHARVIYPTAPATPVINVQPQAERVQSPAPKPPVSLAPETKPEPATPKKAFISQNQPVLTAPEPIVEIPAKPVPALDPEVTSPNPKKVFISQSQPVTTTPIPAPIAKIQEPAVETINVPGAQYVITTPKKEIIPQIQPAIQPVLKEVPVKPVISQVQPVTTAPVAPPVKEKPVAAQMQPVTTAPAPIIKKEPVSVVAQVQPVTATPAAPVLQPVSTAPATVVSPRAAVSQQQPRTTSPYQTGQKEKRRYPVMPGQNRGLRSRGM